MLFDDQTYYRCIGGTHDPFTDTVSLNNEE